MNVDSARELSGAFFQGFAGLLRASAPEKFERLLVQRVIVHKKILERFEELVVEIFGVFDVRVLQGVFTDSQEAIVALGFLAFRLTAFNDTYQAAAHEGAGVRGLVH